MTLSTKTAVKRIRKIHSFIVHVAQMLVGIPDYNNYVAHMQQKHPEQSVMSHKEFFRERQSARYGGNGKGGMRCC